ncbi:MAG: hypothetical protein JHC98_11795 [Thermoleophilaceae bacterium]|nr:hypothetical protein [Thermoleophilaceae bacterium]
MADSVEQPRFVAAAKVKSVPADRAKAWALAIGTVLIAVVGAAEVNAIIAALPSQSDDLFCIDEYATYGLPSTFDHAVYWVTGFVWFAFAALALVTYSPTNLWRGLVASCASGLFVVGAFASFFIVAAESCFGS